MKAIVNYHVIDPKNIGDQLSSPANYFSFPGTTFERADIRNIEPDFFQNKHLIIGGGGLLFPRFLDSISTLATHPGRGKLIAWGVGQQIYNSLDRSSTQTFDYRKYLDRFDLVGIRDFELGYSWVPCASCLYPGFDRQREIKHEFVIFSHKKFQINVPGFPRMTNEVDNIDQVLDFLGSGETILTSSYHGAYWGTLLGRKVLAFPFSSKFHTLKHSPANYPIQKWTQDRKKFQLFGKVLYEFRYKNRYSCKMEDWQTRLKECQMYPDSLQENRDRNQWYYSQILNLLD